MNNRKHTIFPLAESVRPEMLWLTLILLVAAALRFYNYTSFSFSNDELSAINRLRFETFRELVQKGFFVDGHPGGIQVFLWYWSRWFGLTEASLRLPFVIFGILSVFFSHFVAKHWFGKVAGLFTAASVAFLQFPLLYSQVARPYGSGLFFCMLLLFFWQRIVYSNDKGKSQKLKMVAYYLGFVLLLALCMYNHYFSFLLALIIGIAGLFLISKDRLIPYLVSGISAALLFLPHAAITMNHLSYKGVGLWLGKPEIKWIPEHVNHIFNDSIFMIVVFTATSILVSWSGRKVKNEKGSVLLVLIFFVLPILTGYIYSYLVNPVLQHPVLIFSFPFVIMLLFMAGGEVIGKTQHILLGLFLGLGIIGTLVFNRYYQVQHFGEFKGIAEATAMWEKTYGAANMSKVVVANSPFYLDYYFNRLKHESRFDLYDVKDSASMKEFVNLVRNSDKPYFLYAWTKPPLQGLEDIIRSRFPYVEKHITYGSFSRITLFGKRGKSETEPGLLLKRLHHTKAADPFHMDSLTEFSSALNRDLDGYESLDAIRIVSRVKVNPEEFPTMALLVVTIEADHGGVSIWESTLFDYCVGQGEWSTVQHTLNLRGKNCKNSRLKVYVWNKEKTKFMINDFEVSVYNYLNHSPFSDLQLVWGDRSPD